MSVPAPDRAGSSPRTAIESYLRAKDENRPFLMERAFASDATLEVVAAAGTISFPPITHGRDAITDVLVRRFAQSYENVHTFCLADPPREEAAGFVCDWLVGMSEKDGGRVRIGAGRYDWRFRPQADRLAGRLTITIRSMESLDAACLRPVMDWLGRLPCPWCAVPVALAGAPPLAALEPIRACLTRLTA